MNLEQVGHLNSEIKAFIEDEGLGDVDVSNIIVPDDYVTNDRLITAGEAELPEMPPYFKIAKVKCISKEKKTITLEVDPSSVPSCVCGDGCAVNLKGKMFYVKNDSSIQCSIAIYFKHSYFILL